MREMCFVYDGKLMAFLLLWYCRRTRISPGNLGNYRRVVFLLGNGGKGESGYVCIYPI